VAGCNREAHARKEFPQFRRVGVPSSI
jgi:hypothetical protein